jgi:catechol 2,3-dioxygenase-like lactoylglutathione lyase family enzyme
MHIQALSLQTNNLAAQKDFYTTILGVPLLEETTTTFAVQTGATRLNFQQTSQAVLYHIAFTIPRNMFSEARSWVRERVSLLDRNGEDEIFFSGLNARSFYFCDADGNILELIVHYNLEQESEGAFDASHILHVSEIGLPVDDVPALASQLRAEFCIEPYGGSVTEAFAFMGDIYGQFVVVKIGRPWLPTDNVLSIVSPVRITIKGQPERRVQLSPFPYAVAAL